MKGTPADCEGSVSTKQLWQLKSLGAEAFSGDFTTYESFPSTMVFTNGAARTIVSRIVSHNSRCVSTISHSFPVQVNTIRRCGVTSVVPHTRNLVRMGTTCRNLSSSSVVGQQDAAIIVDDDELLENFFKAAKSNDVAAAEDIIESAVFRGLKESVNLTDAFGNSPLMICAQRNWSDSITILLANDHCDVNHQNIFGSSALMCSSSHGHMDALKVLLSCSRVEVDLVSRFGQTALMKAAQAGKLTSIQVLLTKGANATLLNKQGKGVIQIAEEKGHDKVADFFSKYEANKNIDVFAKSVFSPV